MEDYSVLLLQNLKPPPPTSPHLYIRKSLIQHSLLLTCKASQNHNIPYGMFGGLVIEIYIQDRTNTMGAHLITPAMGSHLVMYLAKMQENSKSVLPPNDVERFLLVVQGSATLTNASGAHHQLTVDSYAYPAPNFKHSLECDASATLAVFERRYASLENHVTEQIVGSTDQQPLLETPGKVFELRKLLPPSLPYDFNIHEVPYNQHGLLLLEGQGIYRLGDSWTKLWGGRLGKLELRTGCTFLEYKAAITPSSIW